MELYEELKAYQVAYAAAIAIYRETRKLPKEEQYGITDQMRRASMGIAANIAEGYARKSTPQEFARFLRMGLGSCNEMKVWLSFCKDLKLLSEEFCEEQKESYRTAEKLMGGLIKSLANKS